jgi:hypothetical protein
LISGEAHDRSPGENEKMKRVIGAGVCCILVVAIILGLGLGLGLRDDDPDPTPAPTPVPTVFVTTQPTTTNATITSAPSIVSAPSISSAPSAVGETPAPTQGELVEEVTVVASADTTIFADGQFAGDNFSSEDTMLVQGGQAGNNDLPKAYSLVQFELNRTELGMLMEPADIEFCLDHVEDEEAVERVVTYTACIVPYTTSVNDLTGSNVNYTLPDDCIGGNTVTFDISPSDKNFCIPATDVVMGAANEATIVRRLRGLNQGRRKLLMQDDTLLLAILNPSESDQPGDRFYTSNDVGGRVPLVVFTSMSNSTGTDIPTGTFEPNATEVPGQEPQYEPCSVCGDNMTVTILDAELPDSDGVNCGEVELGCAEGYCDPAQCKVLPSIVFDICGCTANSGEVGI